MRFGDSQRRRSRWICGVLLASLAPLVAVTVGTQRDASAAAAGPSLQVWLSDGGANQLTPQPAVTLGPVSRGLDNVVVTDSQQYQTVSAGFGAAFTDSSAYLLSELKSDSSSSYNTLMNNLVSPNTGIGLSFWRVPMGASDATAAPSYWTDEDTPGGPFALTSYDTGRIIPVIKDALAINPNLKIVGTPWTAPAWMKSNDRLTCSNNAYLLPQYDQQWADYFVDWIKAYQAEGVPIWAVTPQNEPQGCSGGVPSMVWDASGEASWVGNYLAPDLAANGLHQEILGWDHNWSNIGFPQQLLSSSAGSDFGGIAWHCYNSAGLTTGDPTTMTEFHNEYPNVPQYETECNSTSEPGNAILFGSPTPDIALLSLQNWAEGVLLWNVALDSEGGPTLNPCNDCLNPVVSIDPVKDTNGNVVSVVTTLLDNYYQFGQISKFVQVGATHIASTVNANGIITAAFKNPNGQEVLVATNIEEASTSQTATSFEVTWNGQGSFSYALAPGATATFVGTVPPAPTMPGTPVGGETFKIVSRASGKPIGVAPLSEDGVDSPTGPSTLNGAQIVEWTDGGAADQTWTLQNAGNGYFNLVNVNSGKALDDTNGSKLDGTPMQQYTLIGTGNANQQWQITSLGNGYYTFTNRNSGLVLDLTNGSLSDGTAIQQWGYSAEDIRQEWQLTGAPPPTEPSMPNAGAVYRIVDSASGKPIDVTGASTSVGAPIVQMVDNDGLDQEWRLASAGGSNYNIINVNSGMALEDPNSSMSSGTQMEQGAISGRGGPDQQWEFTPLGTGYQLKNVGSGLVLDLASDSLSDGTPVQQSAFSPGSQSQEWQFFPSSSPDTAGQTDSQA